MGYITIMKSNSKPVPFATIMTELFWATEHEQSVFNIACCKNQSGNQEKGVKAGDAEELRFTKQLNNGVDLLMDLPVTYVVNVG